MDEQRKISDKDLIRVLAEYTEKAQRAGERYRQYAGLLGTGTLFSVILMVLFTINYLREATSFIGVTGVTVVLVGLLGLVVGAFGRRSLAFRKSVELAVWQLRRVYELASRREDLGVEIDSGTRLELELRLSEAAFMLTDLEQFHRPEKFRDFTRIGKNSPFREIEPDLQWPPPATQMVGTKSTSV